MKKDGVFEEVFVWEMHECVLLILPTQTEYCAVYKIGLGYSTKELIYMSAHKVSAAR